MAKKFMLINAVHEEQSRVAIVEEGYLHELDIESAHKVQTKSNIYRGRVTKVEASLQAAFVEYGATRQGFLPLNEIHPDYWKEGADKNADSRKLNIQDVLQAKQEILVQVVKEERGNKGAALTTQISLAGRYLVLSPNTSRGGISRKLSDEDRRSMKEILSHLEVPEDMGLIVRTAGKDQRLEALQRDYQYLRRLWDEIRIKSETTPSPALIYLESNLSTRAIRDHFSDDIEEIWVDNHDLYTQTKEFVHAVLPGKEKLVKLYRGKKPLFRQHGVESQCEEIHDHEVRLSSGGSIVIDPTEALTSIDINSSRATKGKHINDTALAINLEAAEEIARQLRIRDIGGLIVIDFIDMVNRKHGQQVEETLRAACKRDKARIQFARISRFGLLEMSRQRLHPSVHESTTEVCPRCQGRGFIRTVEAMALQMLTRMEDLAEAGKKPTLVVQVPSDTGEYLMNNKRDYIARIEENYDVQITLQIRPDLDIPHYRIERQWNENNQQRVEVLEDTNKNKRPVRTGRKLKPVNPVVGVPRAVPEKKETKTSPIKAILDVLTGQKRREKIARQKEEEERLKKKAEGKKRRSRGGRNRRRGKTTQADKETKAVENAEASANQEPTSDSKPKRRRRNRKKNGAASDAGVGADNKASDPKKETAKAGAQAEKNTDAGNNEGNGDTPTRRRRRRRRRPNGASSTAGGEQQSQANKSPTSDAAGNKDASPVAKADQSPTSAEPA